MSPADPPRPGRSAEPSRGNPPDSPSRRDELPTGGGGPDAPRSGTVRWTTAGLWIVAALGVVRIAGVAIEAGGRSSNGFVAYYTASRLLVEGADVARFYDEAWFAERVHRFEPAVHDVFSANPPAMGLLLLPLSPLPYRTARRVWIGASALLLLATVAFLVHALGLKGPWAPGFIVLALAAEPIRECLALGQVYVLVLALLVGSWWGWRSSRPLATGLPLAVTAATKAAALPLWLLLGIGRRRIALALGLAGVAAVVVVTLPAVGASSWIRWLESGRDLAADPRFGVTAFQTLPGYFRHLTDSGPDGLWRPWIPVPWLGRALALSAVAALLAWTLRVAARRPDDDRTYAAFVLVGLLVSPVSHEHHFVMALLPLAILAADAARRDDRVRTYALVAAVVLLLAPLPHRGPDLADGARALLAYPRLYAGLALWALAVVGEPHIPAGDIRVAPPGRGEAQPAGLSIRRRTT